MAENLYSSAHKATNNKYRKEYDRIFRDDYFDTKDAVLTVYLRITPNVGKKRAG